MGQEDRPRGGDAARQQRAGHAWAWTPKEAWPGLAKHRHRTGKDLDSIATALGIKRFKQPARSLELNVLDLYVWRVLEAGVHKRMPSTLEELWEARRRRGRRTTGGVEGGPQVR